MQLGNLPRQHQLIRVAARRSFAFGVKIRRRSNSFPVDLTGAVLRFGLKQPESLGGDPVGGGWTAEVIGDPILGLAQFNFQAEELDTGMPPGEYQFAVTLVASTGYSTTIMMGTFEVVDNADILSNGTFDTISPYTNLAAYVEDGVAAKVYVDHLDGWTEAVNELALAAQGYEAASEAAAAAAADSASDALLAAAAAAASAASGGGGINLSDPALLELIQDSVAAMVTSGGTVTMSYNDALGKLNLEASGVDAEAVRDTIGAAIVGTTGVNVAINDALDTITLSISGLAISQVTGLQAALDLKGGYGRTTVTSNLTPAPNMTGLNHLTYMQTALAGTCAWAAPTGVILDPLTLVVGIKDNGTARAMTWNAVYATVAGGPSLPTTTVPGEQIWLRFEANYSSGKWELVERSDRRHTHPISEITGLQVALDALDHLADYEPLDPKIVRGSIDDLELIMDNPVAPIDPATLAANQILIPASDRMLYRPSSAPASRQVVTIETSGLQGSVAASSLGGSGGSGVPPTPIGDYGWPAVVSTAPTDIFLGAGIASFFPIQLDAGTYDALAVFCIAARSGGTIDGEIALYKSTSDGLPDTVSAPVLTCPILTTTVTGIKLTTLTPVVLTGGRYWGCSYMSESVAPTTKPTFTTIASHGLILPMNSFGGAGDPKTVFTLNRTGLSSGVLPTTASTVANLSQGTVAKHPVIGVRRSA